MINNLNKLPDFSFKGAGHIFVLGCLLSLISINDAHSADAKVYVKGDIGYLNPIPKAKVSTGYQKNKKFKSTYQASIGAGFVFKEKIRTDLTFSHFGDLKYSSTAPNNSGRLVDEHQKLRVNTLLLSAYYDFLHDQTVSPFVGAGVGIANIRPTTSKAASTGSNAELRKRVQKSTNAAFALSAGANVKIQKNLFLEVGYQYTYLGKLKRFYRTDTFVNGGLFGSNPLTTTKSQNLSAQTIYTGLRYVF